MLEVWKLLFVWKLLPIISKVLTHKVLKVGVVSESKYILYVCVWEREETNQNTQTSLSLVRIIATKQSKAILSTLPSFQNWL